MKIKIIALSSGWLFLALFLTSAYFYNNLSGESKTFSFSPITWDKHIQIFDGAIQCNLIGEELLERKQILKDSIFSQVISKEKSTDGYIFYFEDDTKLLSSVLEHVQIEKACCPFFKFDISILPNNQGFALQISGTKSAIEMIDFFD